MDWDVFICHAWEDKESFVRPLAKALEAKGLRVWFDEFTLTVGDSLRRSIDRGLANSRYGIVVLSPKFFAKEWPQKELDGLASREVSGEKVILPIWHNITAVEVGRYSPTLADRVAVSSSRGLKYVVTELLRAMQPYLKELGDERREEAERKAREEAKRLEQERQEREAREKAARERQARWADRFRVARSWLVRILRDPIWQGIAGVIAIIAFIVTFVGMGGPYKVASFLRPAPTSILIPTPTPTSKSEPYTITLAAVPAVIRADGISTATIMATVQDVGGNPLPDVVVGVTATRGIIGLPFVEGEGTEVTKSPGGAWTEVVDPQASGGKHVQSNGAFYPTANASWTFTASTISLLYAKNSLGGIAAVQVDSSPTMLIDMYSAVTTFDEWVFPWMSAGPHTITVRQTSPLHKNPSSGGYLIYVDAFRSGGRTNATGQVVTWLRSSSETSTVTSTVRATALGSGPLFYTETQVIFAWPPAITFTASITPVVLSCGITDTITATVSDGGYPISGTVVTFAVSPSILGNVNPITATTNVTGQAVTVFTANKVGTGVITATAAGISNTLPITVNPGPPVTPTLSASPDRLVATGNTTATVTLTATDACSNAITDGPG